MAINYEGQEINSIDFNGQPANTATLNGTVVWQRTTGPQAFTIGNAGIDFRVPRNGVVLLTINQGTLEGTNFQNLQQLGTVTVDTLRTLTGNVRVPNDSTKWTNAGQLVTITVFQILSC